VRGLTIPEYSHGNIHNHEPTRDRKLLLSKRELHKLKEGVEKDGYSIVVTRIFISQRGWAKLNIALGKGKKLHDKRQSIKEREQKRDIRENY
jgi:SsrA-binding protein